MSVIGHSPLAGASGAAGGSADPLYVDDVFSTFLYDGTGSTITVNNGLDLSGEGGLVWLKRRTTSIGNNILVDTERGAGKWLRSNSNGSELTTSGTVTAFSSNGFTIGNYVETNRSGDTNVAWSFRKAPKFFDVVTYSGTGSVQNISHSLGSVPGMIMIHCRDGDHDWEVYHRATGATKSLHLNKTDAAATDSTVWNNTTPTSSVFTVGTSLNVNQNGHGYVAYVFAHDEQAFGTDSDEAIIKCGSYTGASNTIKSVSLGFEPQWLMIKNTTRSSDSYGVADWWMGDIMRQMSHQNARALRANTYDIEYNGGTVVPTTTGFNVVNQDNIDHSTNGDNYIYIAIRRPHKPPTAGTEVLSIAAASSYQAPVAIPCNFAPDFFLAKSRTNNLGVYAEARLTEKWMYTNSESPEDSNNYFHWDGPGGKTTLPSVDFNDNPVYWQFRRAPGFFDVVCYSGSGSPSESTISHGLGVVPELLIAKRRDNGNAPWAVYSSVTGNANYLRLNTTNASFSTNFWRSTTPTSTTFKVSNNNSVGNDANNYVAYLFATLDGISKVGSFTGTNASIDIDCGFTAGARLVLIKRTDYTDGWYLFDSVRGINSGGADDPYILLNSNAAQVNSFNPISPLNSGFTVNSPATAGNLNSNGATYLFLAIA